MVLEKITRKESAIFKLSTKIVATTIVNVTVVEKNSKQGKESDQKDKREAVLYSEKPQPVHSRSSKLY